jgi:hypothetical protein
MTVGMKKKHGRTGGRQLNISLGFILERESVEGVSSKKAKPTATHRLGVDIESVGGKVPGRLLDGESFLWVTKECCCWATKEDKLWLGHSSAQLSLVPTWR